MVSSFFNNFEMFCGWYGLFCRVDILVVLEYDMTLGFMTTGLTCEMVNGGVRF